MERFLSALAFIRAGLLAIPRSSDTLLGVRPHPTLEKEVGKEFINKVVLSLQDLGFISPFAEGRSAPQLALAADLFLGCFTTPMSITAMLGGAPGVNLFTLHEQEKAKSMGLTKPYLPELEAKAALAAFSIDEVGQRIREAFDPKVQAGLKQNAAKLKPIGNSAKKTAEFLLGLL